MRRIGTICSKGSQNLHISEGRHEISRENTFGTTVICRFLNQPLHSQGHFTQRQRALTSGPFLACRSWGTVPLTGPQTQIGSIAPVQALARTGVSFFTLE